MCVCVFVQNEQSNMSIKTSKFNLLRNALLQAIR